MNYTGKTEASSSSATQVYIDLDIPEVNKFRDRLLPVFNSTPYTNCHLSYLTTYHSSIHIFAATNGRLQLYAIIYLKCCNYHQLKRLGNYTKLIKYAIYQIHLSRYLLNSFPNKIQSIYLLSI